MFNKLHREESGQTALEAAIILIAFIVVASVFAFAVLSAGSESTDKGQEAIQSGLEDVQSSITVQGDVIGEDTDTDGNVNSIVLTVALAGSGEAVDLTDSAGDNAVVIGYRDDNQRVAELDWTVTFIGTHDGDTMLENNELAELSLDVSTLTTPLGNNTQFTVEIKPPSGAVIELSRTTPAAIEAVMDLR